MNEARVLRLIVFRFPNPRVAHQTMTLFVSLAIVLCSQMQVFFCAISMVIAVSQIILSIGITQISGNLEEVHGGFLVFLALHTNPG